jgi:hypothetical protein
MNRPVHSRRQKAVLTILCASLALTSAALAYSDKPKFGADAVPAFLSDLGELG